jgi:hypothetical protein
MDCWMTGKVEWPACVCVCGVSPGGGEEGARRGGRYSHVMFGHVLSSYVMLS